MRGNPNRQGVHPVSKDVKKTEEETRKLKHSTHQLEENVHQLERGVHQFEADVARAGKKARHQTSQAINSSITTKREPPGPTNSHPKRRRNRRTGPKP